MVEMAFFVDDSEPNSLKSRYAGIPARAIQYGLILTSLWLSMQDVSRGSR